MYGTQVMTANFCATKDGVVHTGTKEDIVRSICKFGLTESKQLIYQVKGFEKEEVHSYGDSYTNDEIYKDIIRDIWYRLNSYGWMKYKKI